MIGLIIVQIRSEDCREAVTVQAIIALNDLVEVGKGRFGSTTIAVAIAPDLIVAEVQLPCADDLGITIARDGIHDETLLGTTLLDGLDEGGIGAWEMDLAPRRIIARTTVAQLVDLIAIEVKEPIDLVITVAEIALPICVPWIQEVDITLPA